jgi:hypothetical protein
MTRSQLARRGGAVTSEGELADREARLGVPIFASPAQGVGEQIADMAEATNEDLIPGSRVVMPGVVERNGFNLWDRIVAAEAMKLLDDFIERLFG